MDDADIPMLDVGDFEVLDECADDDEDDEQERHRNYESNEDDEKNSDCDRNHRFRSDRCVEDDGENVLDVSIDIENDFLENVATDLSQNFEDDIDEKSKSQSKSGKRSATEIYSQSDTNKFTLPPKPLKSALKKPKKIELDFGNDQKVNSSGSNGICDQENDEKSELAQGDTKILQNKPAYLKSDMTDDEIMIHFDEIENAVLNSESFVIENDKDNKKDLKVNEENKPDDVIVVDPQEENWDEETVEQPKKAAVKIEELELKENEEWYREKIKAKENALQEKFSKLANLIQYSFPLYKNWLDKNESIFNSAVCRIETSKHPPLDQLLPLRWKFICNKKYKPPMEEDNSADSSSEKKNEPVWTLKSGAPDSNLENVEEYPPFVMRVVEVIMEFLQSNYATKRIAEGAENESTKSTINNVDSNVTKVQDGGEKITNVSEKENIEKKDDVEEIQNKNPSTENQGVINKGAKSDDKSTDMTYESLTILIRSNHKKELMIHITGKTISSEFKNQLKDLFLNGCGKDYNVQSMFVKSIVKKDKTIHTENVNLFGNEYLQENVGNVKIHLTPKTNIWLNALCSETLGNAITQFLLPSKKTVVIEIGCGIGLNSLMLASKCQEVIAADVEKEIAEAKETCELNEIKNVTFLTGKPKVIMAEISKKLKTQRGVAIINTNSFLGRSVDVMLGIRKMSSIARVVLITTVTKQAIKSILELMQPQTVELGNPLMPIKACVVDMQPKGVHFDIIISCERRNMRTILRNNFNSNQVINPVGLLSPSKLSNLKINVPNPAYKQKLQSPNQKTAGKFSNSMVISNIPVTKKFAKIGAKSKDMQPRSNLIDQALTEAQVEPDLREKLSNSSKSDTAAIMQEIQEQKKLLDAAKEKLSNPSSVDNETVKKLQEMLTMAIEKTNKLQSQLPPRSIWDRIAPADASSNKQKKNVPTNRTVKGSGMKDIVVTTPNKKTFNNNQKNNLKMKSSVVKKQNAAPYHKNTSILNNPKIPTLATQWNIVSAWDNISQAWDAQSLLPIQNTWSKSNQQNKAKKPHIITRSRISPMRRPQPVEAKKPPPPVRREPSPRRPSPAPPIRQQPTHPLKQFQSHPVRRPERPESPKRFKSGRMSPPRALLPNPKHTRGPSPPRPLISRSPPRSLLTRSPPRSLLTRSPPRSLVTRSPPRSLLTRSPPRSILARSPPRPLFPRSPPRPLLSRSPPRSLLHRKSPPRPLLVLPPREKSPKRFTDDWDIPTRNTIEKSSWLQNRDPVSSRTINNVSTSSTTWKPRTEDSWNRTESQYQHQSRWETNRKEKEDWNDLPEDARDPWGDDSSPKMSDNHWNPPQNIPSTAPAWNNREQPHDNWQNKMNFSSQNNIGGGNFNPTNYNNPSINSYGNSGMNNFGNSSINSYNVPGIHSQPQPSSWQHAQSQPHTQPQPILPPVHQNRIPNQNWIPPSTNNWQSSGYGGHVQSNPQIPALMNNWNPPQQTNFQNRFNMPFTNNRL